MKFNLILMLFLFACWGCDPFDDKLILINKTSDKIYYTESLCAILATFYEANAKVQGSNLTYLNFIDELRPGQEKRVMLPGRTGAWINYVNKYCEDQKLRIYTFNIDTLKKYSWKDVMYKNIYVNKIEVSVKDLDALNWKVEFTD
jgi:hypothetical protein